MASTINASTSSGLVNTADTSGVLQLQTANTTALTIDASQNLTYVGALTGGTGVVNLGSGQFYKDASGSIGLGTTSPSTRLHTLVTGTTAGIKSETSGSFGGVQVRATNGVTQDWIVAADASGNGKFVIYDVVAGQYRIQINGNGNVALSSGNATADGVGITFPATQSGSSNANCLDDYEEGTWTPTLVSTGGGAPAYTTQVGRYYKIGGVVYVFGTITINGTLPSGNYTRIQGLPFGQSSAQSGVALKYSGATTVASGQFITAAIGGSEISFARNDGNGEIGAVGLNASYISTTFSATFSTVYQVS